MTLQLEGQLDLFALLPLVCQHCGEVCNLDRPYDVHNFPRFHTEAEAGLCKELAWARRGYRHAIWAVSNFDRWFKLAAPGAEQYAKQLQSMTAERDRFEARCAAYTARVGSAWLELAP
ncbi:hypothetical protein ACIQXM_01880 [Arthrobacter sp. NPDC097144]|uniref:hypothetical protein n=1 Tax=Arthrobacter sp. NPDC097144 TaxID=3363946 RepID=UPI00380349DE